MIDEPGVSLDQDEAIVAELHRLGVGHLVRFQPHMAYAPMDPAELIAALANHHEARLRSALILLFLCRPSLSSIVRPLLPSLAETAAQTLRLYYQAAAYLRLELEAELQSGSDDTVSLPDLFSAELGLPAVGSVSAEAALSALGQLHTHLSGRAYNWAGSYRQHVPLFLRQLRSSARAGLSA